MNDYTVTYPVHLLQKVWVDTRTLPTNEIDPSQPIPAFLKAEIRGLMIQAKGDSERKSMKFRIKANWRCGDNKYKESYKYFKYSISAMGKTVFARNPNELEEE